MPGLNKKDRDGRVTSGATLAMRVLLILVVVTTATTRGAAELVPIRGGHHGGHPGARSAAVDALAGISNGCYERAAIGERLPEGDVATVQSSPPPTPPSPAPSARDNSDDDWTLRRCLESCMAIQPPCPAFSFGIHGRGNTTCELGRRASAHIREDADFDLYVRRPECDDAPPNDGWTRLPLLPHDGPRGNGAPQDPDPAGPDAAFRPPRPSDKPSAAIGGPTNRPVFEDTNNLFAPPDLDPNLSLPSVCFRRILRGCRLDESLVRHSLPAINVEACRRACMQEDHFTCEGFNYRANTGACELTAVPLNLLDLNRDARSERDFDVFVRDRNAQPPNCPPDDFPFPGPPPGSGLYPDNSIGDGYAPGHHGWSPPGNTPSRPSGGAEVGFYGQHQQTSSSHHNHYPDNYSPNYGYDYNQLHNALLPHPLPPPPPPRLDPPSQPPPIQPFVPRPDRNGECFVRARGGYRLSNPVVQSVVEAPDLPGCEHACSTARFRCNSFSFRYNVWPYNCDLSVLFPKLDLDLILDRNADVFLREQSCAPRPPGWDAKSECFVMSRPHSNTRLDGSAVKDTILAESLGGCEAACLAATGYICRAFSYRYGSAPPDAPVPAANCLLSDWPPEEIVPWRHTKGEAGTQLYGRDSYGRGCELDWKRMDGIRDRPLLPQVSPPPKPTIYDQFCYVGWGRPARLVPSATFTAMRVPTELDCKTICTRARGTANCASISFKSSNVAPGEPNCALSDKQLQDLRPGFDVDPHPDYWLFSWNSQEPHCAVLPHEPPPPHLSPYGNDPYGPHGPHGHYDPHRQYEHGQYDMTGSHYSPSGEDAIWRDESAGVWKRFSVTGQPCRSLCAPHPIGIWSCELQNGGWDYCCRPGHNCGFSEGYPYPWCYVGNSDRDQWRPCSENYQPNYPHGPHGQGPHGQGHGHHHYNEEARYWPVSYLHPAPPYNISATRGYPASTASRRPPWIPVTRTSKLLPFNTSSTTTSTTTTTPRTSSTSTTRAPVHKDSDDIFGSEAVATTSNATSNEPLELEIIDTLDGAGSVAENITSVNRTHIRRKLTFPDDEDEEEYEDDNSDGDDNSAKNSQRKHKILKISA